MDLIQSVRESYDRCCLNGDFPATFYELFFTKSPEIPKLFLKYRQQLGMALSLIVYL